MTPEQQSIAIAEACGWTDTQIIDGKYGQTDVPNYLNDLNAMHDAEKVLTSKQKQTYAKSLSDAMSDSAPTDSCNTVWADTIHATASQRAEAFLCTIGKWEEAK